MRLPAVEVETLIPFPELHARVRAVRPRVRPGVRYLEAMNQAVEQAFDAYLYEHGLTRVAGTEITWYPKYGHNSVRVIGKAQGVR